jgi:hypothetical protein
MQQRYYDPIAGRFLSVDPITTNADNGSMFNRYEYAQNNPYRYIDPEGTCTGSNIKASDGQCPGGGSIAGGHSGSSTHYGEGGSASQSSRTNSGVAGSGLQPNSGASRTLGSYLPGTDAGDSAAQYWANKQVETGNGLYIIPGMLASLWTPETAAATAITLGTGGLGGIKAIPQGLALGWKNTVGIWSHTYKHGGGGINFFVGGSRVFAVDYHAFKLNGVVASRLHYHRGLTPATQKLHRPYQGGP